MNNNETATAKRIPFVVTNIINQIGDLYAEQIPSSDWVRVRQETNDILDQFVANLLLTHDKQMRADGWDKCLDALDEHELNLDQAREGNPYRAGRIPPEGAEKEACCVGDRYCDLDSSPVVTEEPTP